MKMAIEAAKIGVKSETGGPFGAVIVKDGEVVSIGCNSVTSTNDPTAHAEVVAIRKACEKLGNFQLDECILYTSCEPCPMCLGAIYWARPKAVYYACVAQDAADIGFDDSFIYEEIKLPFNNRAIPFKQVGRPEGLVVFKEWTAKTNRIDY
jgi:tRNA(Arg) A34 adenosine deaminase TadA